MFFGVFQCLPVNDCPADSCDSGVLTRGSESTSFYSAILVPPSGIIFLKAEITYRQIHPQVIWSVFFKHICMILLSSLYVYMYNLHSKNGNSYLFFPFFTLLYLLLI